MIERLRWLGHSGFRWEARLLEAAASVGQGSKTIYFDPWKLSGEPKKADIICVSHEHFDHMSKPDIKAISTADTVIVTCNACRDELSASKIVCKEIKALAPGSKIELDGIKITAVPSYNTNKEFHPKNAKKLGFVVTMGGVSVYHAGDTDRIPEMDALKCDVALLPISGTYVMTADEAAEAAIVIGPKVAIPMHYGDIIGSLKDAKRFEALLKGKVEVKILKKED